MALGVRSFKSPKSAIKETRSPHHPLNLFSSSAKQPPAKLDTTETIVIDDEQEQEPISRSRTNKLLAGICESSSDELHNTSSDSETASESKRYKAAQRTIFKGDEPAKSTRASTRLRKKRELLDLEDDGESSVGSVLTNDYSKSGD